MTHETTFLYGLAVTIVAVTGVALFLNGSLKPLVNQVCDTDARARFWLAAMNLLLVFIPLVALFMNRTPSQPYPHSPVLAVVELLWPVLLGIIFAILLVMVQVGVLSNLEREFDGRIVPRRTNGELKRLLDRVDEVRSRETVLVETAGKDDP